MPYLTILQVFLKEYIKLKIIYSSNNHHQFVDSFFFSLPSSSTSFLQHFDDQEEEELNITACMETICTKIHACHASLREKRNETTSKKIFIYFIKRQAEVNNVFTRRSKRCNIHQRVFLLNRGTDKIVYTSCIQCIDRTHRE